MRKQFYLWIGLAVTFLLVFSLSATANSATLHVKTLSAGGNDTNSGVDWAHAKASVSGAISAANAGDEIWVAAGTYAEHIQIAKEVALYGGFRGDETARDQRDWTKNIAILDGGGNASTPPSSDGTVVKISNIVGPSTRVDGFTITGGHGIHGGGIKIVASAPVIANNIIKKNRTDGAGGGISIWGYIATTPPVFSVITNNTIVENSSINDEGDGGGIAVVGSSPTISHNVIARNEATRNGGGIACWRDNSPRIENNFILANSASVPLSDNSDTATESPASYGGGGIFASATDLDGTPILDAVSAPIIINNVLAANGAFKGGGICVVNSIITDLVATIINNTVVANNGSGIYWENTSPTITNNLVAFNVWGLQQGTNGIMSPTIRYNNVYGNTLANEKTNYQGLTDQTALNGNISADPKMANYWMGDFHLQPGSPCINAGSTGAVGSGWTDIDGQSRVIGSAVDIGADESDGTLWNVPGSLIHVRTDGDDSKDGLTWATAKKTVTSGIAAAASTGGEVWVAKGTYTERLILKAFVYLYGGFAGTETNRGSRNISANTTILDGGGKPPEGSIPTVVKSMNGGYLVSSLDGFTIQNGGFYTGGTLSPNGVEGLGGGIYCQVASPYIVNNVIKNNSLGDPQAIYTGKGGGIALYRSYAAIYSNTIRDNEILFVGGEGEGGGAIYVGNMSMPDIAGNTIIQNHAKFGAAIASIGSEPFIQHNVIQNNAMYVSLIYTGSTWGAISMFECPDFVIEGNWVIENTASIGGGISVNAGFGGKILNNIITSNSAYDYTGYGGGGMGGGIYCEVAANSNNIFYILNNTITDNDATNSIFGERGGGIAVVADSSTNQLVIANNIIAFNSSGIDSLVFAPHLSNNDVFNDSHNYIGLSSGINDISVDPGFVNRPEWDFHLNPTSPCIDRGSNSAVPTWLTTDFEGNPRIMDGDNNGTYIVDIGAYEFPGPFADTTPPTPNPMTWAMSPYGASATSISMVATTATDAGSPPVSYYFHFVNSPTGGAGGSDASWQSSTSYTNTGLQPNHQYGYQVKARDSASTPNETSYSSTVYKYTLANVPEASPFSNVTQTCIRVNWTANANRSGTEYYCENITAGTNSGGISGTFWDSCSLACGTSYSFRVKAKNGDGLETDWTSLGSQTTQACPDTTGPSLSITSHNNGQHVTTSSITLAGTASDSGKGDNGIQQVTVNGVRASNDTTTGNETVNWSKMVPLSPGANNITVIAYDNSSNHNQTFQNLTIYYDPVTVNCSGQSLQAAVDAALPGDIIKVSGTCNENALIRNEKIRFILDGQNVATIHGANSGSPALNVRGKGIVIQNFEITGGNDGINVNRGSNAQIIHNNIHNTGGYGIVIDQLSFSVIRNNNIHNNPGDGILVSENSIARIGFDSDSDSTPSSNTIQNNGGNGITVLGTSNARIVGNTIANNTGDGIGVLGHSQADIASNTINNNGGNGISVSEKSGIQLGEDNPTTFFDQPNTTTVNNVGNGIACSMGAYVGGHLGSTNQINGAAGQTNLTGGCINGGLFTP